MRSPVSVLLRLSVFAAVLLVGACAAVQPERSTGRQIDDFNATAAIKSAMLRAEGYRLGAIEVEVTEGVALLTGSAPRQEDRVYAECVTWSAPAVRQVSNRIQVGGRRTRAQSARDALITQRVRARLMADSSVRSVNFNIKTHNGVVHLLGFARNDAERERAAMHASLAENVQEVVDLVRVFGQTPDTPPRGALQAAACDGPAAPTAAPALDEPEPVDEAPLRPIDPAPTVDAEWLDPQ